jgi:hypothetical protein
MRNSAGVIDSTVAGTGGRVLEDESLAPAKDEMNATSKRRGRNEVKLEVTQFIVAAQKPVLQR